MSKYDTSKLAAMGYGDAGNGDTVELTDAEVAALEAIMYWVTKGVDFEAYGLFTGARETVIRDAAAQGYEVLSGPYSRDEAYEALRDLGC